MLVKLQRYFSTDAVHVPPPLEKIHLNTEQVSSVWRRVYFSFFLIELCFYLSTAVIIIFQALSSVFIFHWFVFAQRSSGEVGEGQEVSFTIKIAKKIK